MTIDADLLRTPAGRLAQLLGYIKGYVARTNSRTYFRNSQVLREYLGLEDGDTSAYFAAVAEIMSMPVDIRRAASALENPIAPPEMLLQHMDRIESALPLLGTPHGNVKDVWDRVGDDVIVGLQFTSRILVQGGSLRAIDKDRLNEIRTLATTIIDELAGDTELSPRFREEIRGHAQSIIAAVNSYKLHGADGLLDEADALVGVLARSDETKSRKEHPALKSGVALANAIIFAAGVFVAPLELAQAGSTYADVLELPVSTEAPDGDVVEAEIVS